MMDLTESSDQSQLLRTEQSIKENGTSKPTKKTEEVFRYGLMAQDTMASGLMEKHKAMADSFMLKVMYMKVIGSRIKLMDMESTHITTVPNSQVIGFLTNNKVTEKNSGQMVHNTKVTIRKEWNTEKVNSNGLIKALSKEISTKITSKVPENTGGPMVESTMDNGSTIKWKDMELSLGQMAESTSDNIRMTKNTDKVLLNGQMAETI
jgi:hypothetical protein